MSLRPDGQKRSSGMPQDTSKLLVWIDENWPLRLPTDDDLSTEPGRIRYARYLGQRDLLSILKSHQTRIEGGGD